MATQNKKDLVGYNPKPKQRTCSNCKQYSSDSVKHLYGYVEEKNIRCALHGFAVKKSANCSGHEFRVD